MLGGAGRGVFLASTGLEHDRVDVWGNAMAGASGFASQEQARAIFNYFARNEGDIFFEGQVRQIPSPQHWDVAMGHQWIGTSGHPSSGNPTGQADAAGGTAIMYQVRWQHSIRRTGGRFPVAFSRMPPMLPQACLWPVLGITYWWGNLGVMCGEMWDPEEVPYSAPQTCSNIAPHCITAPLNYPLKTVLTHSGLPA